MSTIAIIQARMGSSRLPGKVLRDLAGEPVLAWVVRAARSIFGIDDVVVATTTSASDDPIIAWCAANRVLSFRGSEMDVLSRFAGAADATGAKIIIRMTADCPLFDPVVGGQTLALLHRASAEYACNQDPPTWPDGLDCEVFTIGALQTADREATRPSEREHVTPFLRSNRSRFRTETLVCPLPGLSKERWTLDTEEDMAFLQAVAAQLPKGRPPSHLEVLSVLDRYPHLGKINAAAKRDAGFSRSVAAEPLFTSRRFTRSQEQLRRAEKTIPLGSQTFSKSRIQLPPDAAPLFLTHGQGGRVWDVDGNEYVDLVNALMPLILGYRDPDVDAAIRRQVTRGISFSLATELEADVAERLVRHIPCAEMVRFGKNGTDATSGAVRLARAATRRDRIMLCGYHGWQDWYIGATTRNRGVPDSVSKLSHIAPYGNLQAVDELLSKYRGEFAALIIEPTNVTPPPPGYLPALKDLVHSHGALLIFDEVITGFRWSIGGAQARYGVTPDLASFGKALGNGMPISAVVGRADILHLMEEIFFSSTFGGEALSLAAACATLDKLERERVSDRLWETGQRLLDSARSKIQAAGLGDFIELVGSPPWAILTYKDHPNGSKEQIKTLFLRSMIAAGVLINSSHNVCFAHDEDDVAHILLAYDYALEEVRLALETDSIARRLGNKVIHTLFSVRQTQ